MRISIVVAMSPEGLIGAGGKLPWHMPADLRHFRRLTTGHTVMMGRKTYDSLRRPLPNRRNFVLTRRGLAVPPPPAIGIGNTVEYFNNLPGAIVAARQAGESELFVIGGAEIYALALPLVQRLYVTIVHVDEPRTGDTWFPQWNRAEWRPIERIEQAPLEFITFERRLKS